MSTLAYLDSRTKKKEELSIRRVISEFQSIFQKECQDQRIDDAASSFSDRNEIVHVYENYQGNMETVVASVENYLDEYEEIWKLLWDYAKKKGFLQEK